MQSSTTGQTKVERNDNDPESLLKVRARYGQLQDLISNLGVKLSQVTSIHEKEFLSAYRVHMLNVQLELKELKSRVAKAEESLQDDDVVSRLEEECQWFRNEKNMLQLQATAMEKDAVHMRTRLRTLKEQRDYLTDQLKTIMKKSRLIEAELEFHTSQTVSQSIAPDGDMDRTDSLSLHSRSIKQHTLMSASLPGSMPSRSVNKMDDFSIAKSVIKPVVSKKKQTKKIHTEIKNKSSDMSSNKHPPEAESPTVGLCSENVVMAELEQSLSEVYNKILERRMKSLLSASKLRPLTETNQNTTTMPLVPSFVDKKTCNC